VPLSQIDFVLAEWQSAEALLRELPRGSSYHAAVELAAQTLRDVCCDLQRGADRDVLIRLEQARDAIRGVRVATVRELIATTGYDHVAAPSRSSGISKVGV
jgi:hypothetical protein